MLKKIVLIFALTGTALTGVAQDINFGLTGGFVNVGQTVKEGNITISDAESGIYVGAFANFNVNNNFAIQPELLYSAVEDVQAIVVPFMAKFYMTDILYIQAGPQVAFTLEDIPDNFTGVEFDLAGGLGLDITDLFFLQARYSLQLNNSFTGNDDIKVRFNYLTIGAGYKFW
ncbi:PorT family protein [Flagellimonas sp. HMM57]|uniref:outer membrane beta-barrel protein n=1 Tax=unclassified Flagellimonas TaxID=2644544 RepID=UPI0013D03F7A|nr:MULTISPECIES: outer membrane beta-barrel protein [unclassified Flagellimonas]UII76346.1 PorT family protein [Flagellimonas sp. HMM57]